MLKQILIKCSELINRDDISSILKNHSSINEIENQALQSDVIKMITYYNFVVENIYENYLKAYNIETLVSDENNQIDYSNFKFKPIKILDVKSTLNQSTAHSIHSKYILTNLPNTEFIIHYQYTPNEADDLSDEVFLPLNLNARIIIYGIASEFLASKDQFEKSEFWKDKFLYEIFKTKIKKERRLKSNFLIWNNIQKTTFLQTLVNQLTIIQLANQIWAPTIYST